MCLALYLFTERNLPESSWNKDDPKVFIEAVTTASNDRGALDWPHGCKHVYYIGSYQGCGCGWSPLSDYDEDDDRTRKLRDRSALIDILVASDVSTSSFVCCWEGDQGQPMRSPQFLSWAQIQDGTYEFAELQEYRVSPGADTTPTCAVTNP